MLVNQPTAPLVLGLVATFATLTLSLEVGACVDGANGSTCVHSAPRGNALLQRTSLSNRLFADEAGPSVTSCGFEPRAEKRTKKYCGLWAQKKSDRFDWNRQSGKTRSRRTGPQKGAAEGKYYMYIEASCPRRTGDRASLIATSQQLGNGASLTFKYHMYGSQMGALKVKVGGTLEIEKAGNLGDSWQTATLVLSKYAGLTVDIEFEGTRGRGYLSDLAIDDVTLDRGTAGPIPPTPPTPPPTMPTCGAADSKCRSDVDWAYNHGRWSSPDVYTGPLGRVCGITGRCRIQVVRAASRDDFQRLFFCGEYGAQKKCSLPPCQCTNPPCDTCSAAAATPPPAPPPAPPATPGSNPSPNSPSAANAAGWALAMHNTFRCTHCDTPVLTWSSHLAAQAAACAKTCPTGHTCDTHGAGENLYYKGTTAPLVEDQSNWDDAIQSWYGEEVDWNYTTSKGDGGVVGHFTQVVWKASTEVGCAMNIHCKNKFSGYKNSVVVCRYTSAGNYRGQEAANVKNLVSAGACAAASSTCSNSVAGGTPTAAPTAAQTSTPVTPASPGYGSGLDQAVANITKEIKAVKTGLQDIKAKVQALSSR